MKIVDSFFDPHILKQLKNAIKIEIADESCILNYVEQSADAPSSDAALSEKEHYGLINSKYYLLKGPSVNIILQQLIDKKYAVASVIDNWDGMLRYHENKAPYGAQWHLDGLYENNNTALDYVGITIFLNDTWHVNYGGMFVYKETKEDTQGIFIEPIGNRIIINTNDLLHAVTPITNNEVTRYSLQMFINHKYLI
jgi:hypothetical protein